MKKIDKIIEIIRENMIASGGVPTNNISSGNIDKFDPVMTFDGRSKIARRLPPPYKKSLSNKKKKK
jgi:hypothetical protein